MKKSVAAERVLLLRQRLLQNIVDMVNVCNQQAAEQKQRDPLSHVEYHLAMTAATDRKADSADAIAVRIMVTYLSGHGEESAHVLSDAVSFTVTDAAVVDIDFQGQDTEEMKCISLDDRHIAELIERIRSFCTRHMPAAGGYSA